MHLVDTTMFWSTTGGGVRRYLLAKQAWLAGKPGWRHSLAVPGRDEAAAPTSGLVSLPSWPLPGSGGYRLPLQRGAIAKRLQALRPDVIEAGDPYRIAWSTLDAAQRLGVPALAFCHSNLEAMARLLAGKRLAPAAGRAARAYTRRVYAGYDAVLAPSRAMGEHLRAWGVAHVEQQPLGVDTTLFHPARASAVWRASLGLAPGTRLLVYAGRLAPEKHLQVLADAVDRLGPPYMLLLIGDGPSPPQGGRLLRLPFLADVTAMATALASADAFVHAGDQETFGLSVLEAMACGTPVVARQSEGLAELVDAQVGVAVPAAPAGAGAAALSEPFAQAIASLFEPGAATTLRRAAARARAECYSWQQVLPQMLSRYARLACVPLAAAPGGAAVAPRSKAA